MLLGEILEQRIPRNPNKLAPSVPSQQHLYHGAQLYGLALVLQSNALHQGGHWGKPGEPHGVRCTRSVAVAKTFAFDQEFPGGFLELSWPKIAQRWKTIPYADSQYNDQDRSQPGEPFPDEQEEVVLASAIKPLNEYLEAVMMRKAEHDLLMAGEYLKNEWTGSFAAYDGRPLWVHRRAIRTLMAYPVTIVQ